MSNILQKQQSLDAGNGAGAKDNRLKVCVGVMDVI